VTITKGTQGATSHKEVQSLFARTVIAAVALISFFETHDKVQLYKIVLNNHTKSCVNKAIAFRKFQIMKRNLQISTNK
jgi:PIN domain nuclease of toxin-antitoxin system